MNNKELIKIAREVALLTFDISFQKKVGHIGSALSISDLLSVLYFNRLNVDKNNLRDEMRDRFILSKGHAAAALYSVLYKKGILTRKQFESFAENGGLCEHPELGTPGIEMTSGSLGHGLAFGAGIAWGLKKMVHGSLFKVHSRKRANNHEPITNNQLPHVFVLISDGECGEGSVWEAALFASRMKLDNLTVILDYDGWQCFGESGKITHLRPLAAKWRAFGFGVATVNGHDLVTISKVLKQDSLKKGRPSMIIAKTLSGHGIPEIEDKLIGHYKIFTPTEYLIARKELKRSYGI